MDGFVGSGDETCAVLGKEAAVQDIWTVFEKVLRCQAVGTWIDHLRKVGMVGVGPDLEDEGRGEGAMVIAGVTQEESIGLKRVAREQETTDGSCEE